MHGFYTYLDSSFICGGIDVRDLGFRYSLALSQIVFRHPLRILNAFL